MSPCPTQLPVLYSHVLGLCSYGLGGQAELLPVSSADSHSPHHGPECGMFVHGRVPDGCCNGGVGARAITGFHHHNQCQCSIRPVSISEFISLPAQFGEVRSWCDDAELTAAGMSLLHLCAGSQTAFALHSRAYSHCRTTLARNSIGEPTLAWQCRCQALSPHVIRGGGQRQASH